MCPKRNATVYRRIGGRVLARLTASVIVAVALAAAIPVVAFGRTELVRHQAALTSNTPLPGAPLPSLGSPRTTARETPDLRRAVTVDGPFFISPLRGTVNPIAPPIRVILQAQGAGDVLAVTGFKIEPVGHGASTGFACFLCTGHGHFRHGRTRFGVFKDTVQGLITMTPKTVFFGDLTKPGEMGRIELLRVAFRTTPTPSTKLKTCLGADTHFNLVDLKHIPLVPCDRRLPGDSVAFSTPAELSSSERLPAAVAGKTLGPRWVSIFGESGGRCLRDPQEYGRPQALWHVDGKFAKTFTVGTATTSGAFCAYVSQGGLFDKLPDGPLTLVGANRYFAGDSVQISGPTVVAAGQQIVDTYVGHASTTVELYTFKSTQPCQPTAQAEAPLAYAFFTKLLSPGNFSQPVLSPPLTVSSYACAYLQTGAPTDAGTPTGAVLVGSQSVITVVPPATALRRVNPRSTRFRAHETLSAHNRPR